MKLFCVILFSILPYLGLAQCPTTDIVMNTQEDVDNFVLDYPGCTELLEALIIDGNTIENLKGLGSIERIGGSLRILETGLTHLMGLDQLQSVGGEFQLQGNDMLIDLEGLFSLDSVLRLFIISNESLLSLDGLDALTTIEVPESIVIADNNSLVSINALSTVVNCPSCWIIISLNSNLTNLGGLENIPASDIAFLGLTDNPMLVTCNLPNICEYLVDGGTHEIENNAPGCASQSDIVSNCLFSILENGLNPSVILLPNPVSEVLQIQLPEAFILRSTEVYSVLGELLISTSEETVDLSDAPNGIYFIAMETNFGDFMGKILKQ
ncbi:MAG: T9SS type A sorting domain-containing protein [Bacteroidota bacterium]